MKMIAILAAAAAVAGTPAAAQTGIVVPASTDVVVALTQPVTSRNARIGQRIPVVLTRDVMVGNTVAIPRGTRGWSEVTWRTGRGVYGKSGKVELTLRSLDVNGQPVAIGGRLREEGDGNTAATVGVALLAGLLPAAVVIGHSAVIPEGREIRGTVAAPATIAYAAPAPVYAMPRVTLMAASAPVSVLGAAVDARSNFERALAAQRGVRGRAPGQGWTISD
jgi:hypothetical protein